MHAPRTGEWWVDRKTGVRGTVIAVNHTTEEASWISHDGALSPSAFLPFNKFNGRFEREATNAEIEAMP
jgi:hypothetical protein